MAHPHTVHLPLGALLIWRTVCGGSYHINSLSLNSDGESFLSCDDLRLNLWHLGVTSSCFNIVDVKPLSMESLSEVITSSDCHPSHCQMFLYSSSRGCVRLGDMRAAALCDSHAKVHISAHLRVSPPYLR